MEKQLINLFNKPKFIGIVGDVNSAKSNLLYYLITELKKATKFKLVTYGLRRTIKGSQEIFSVQELETIENSIIVLDEVMSMWDLDNRKEKKMIEKTLRLIFHNNNVLVICALPENIKKFIANKLDVIMFKKCTLGDFINGSKAKRIVLSYKNNELGSSVLNIQKGDVVVFDGTHYNKYIIPYLKEYDTKAKNVPIIVPKEVRKKGKNMKKTNNNEKGVKNNVKIRNTKTGI